MHYGKILFYIFSILWELGVVIQQVYWMIDGNYNFTAFIWGLIEIWFPYLIYKAITED